MKFIDYDNCVALESELANKILETETGFNLTLLLLSFLEGKMTRDPTRKYSIINSWGGLAGTLVAASFFFCPPSPMQGQSVRAKVCGVTLLQRVHGLLPPSVLYMVFIKPEICMPARRSPTQVFVSHSTEGETTVLYLS